MAGIVYIRTNINANDIYFHLNVKEKENHKNKTLKQIHTRALTRLHLV